MNPCRNLCDKAILWWAVVEQKTTGICDRIFNQSLIGENHILHKLLRSIWFHFLLEKEVVGDPGIEPGVRLREGVTVPCHTLRPVAH